MLINDTSESVSLKKSHTQTTPGRQKPHGLFSGTKKKQTFWKQFSSGRLINITSDFIEKKFKETTNQKNSFVECLVYHRFLPWVE